MQALVYSQSRDVRPSVRHTPVLYQNEESYSVMISSPSESQNILVSRNIWFITKFDRGQPKRGRFLRLGWVRTGDFCDFSTNKPPYLRNGQRCKIGPKLLLITNRKSYTRFRLVTKSTTWMTLNWPWMAIMRSVALHTCLSEPTTKIWMKIDPYYQRLKCSPGIAVSSKVRFMRIFGGVQMKVGSSKMAIFAYFTRHIFRTFTSEATVITLRYVVP